MRRHSVVGTLVLMSFVVPFCVSTASARDLNKFAVRFTNMRINSCPEVGSCDWKLLCRLGDEAETELIRMSEADTGETIEVNGSFERDGAPPVTVTCTVREFDSSIGLDSPVWELVGTNTITFQEGHQEMRIDQHRDEGDVTVKLIVEGLATVQSPSEVQPPPPPPAAPTGCRADGPGRCGALEVKCDVPCRQQMNFLSVAWGTA